MPLNLQGQLDPKGLDYGESLKISHNYGDSPDLLFMETMETHQEDLNQCLVYKEEGQH